MELRNISVVQTQLVNILSYHLPSSLSCILFPSFDIFLFFHIFSFLSIQLNSLNLIFLSSSLQSFSYFFRTLHHIHLYFFWHVYLFPSLFTLIHYWYFFWYSSGPFCVTFFIKLYWTIFYIYKLSFFPSTFQLS